MTTAYSVTVLLQSLKDFDRVKELDIDAVSIPCYQAEDICNTGSTQFEGLKAAQVSHPDIEELACQCRIIGIKLIGTPGSLKEAQFLARIGVDQIAIDAQHIPRAMEFINPIAQLKKPMVLRLGNVTWEQIGKAFYAAHAGHHVTLLHQNVSRDGEVLWTDHNLGLITELTRVYPKCIIGYSDATGTTCVEMAYGLGGRVYECTPDYADAVVTKVRHCQELMGKTVRYVSESERAWREMMNARE